MEKEEAKPFFFRIDFKFTEIFPYFLAYFPLCDKKIDESTKSNLMDYSIFEEL